MGPYLEAVRNDDCMLLLRKQPRDDVRLGVSGPRAAKLSKVVMQESIEPSGVTSRCWLVQLNFKGLQQQKK